MSNIEFTIFLAGSFFIAIITGVMGIFSFNVKAKGAKALGSLLTVIALWCFSIGGQMLSNTVEMSLQWGVAMIFGVSLVPPAFVIFAHYFTGREDRLYWWKLVLLFLEPVATIIIFIVPAWHHLFLEEVFYQDISGYLVMVGFAPGVQFWVHAVAGTIMALVADVMILKHALQWPRSERSKLLLLILASFFPMITNFGQRVGLFGNVHGNMDVLGFALAGILIGIVFYYHRMLELQPLAGRQLMEKLPDALLVFDDEWALVEGNPAAQELFDDPIEESVKEHLSVFMQEHKTGENLSVRKKLVLHKDAEDHHFDVHSSPLMMRSQVVGYQMLLRDVTDLIRSMEQMEQLAITDPLTNLYNRRYFHMEGERIYAQAFRYQHPICLMTFDLDHFKQINDQHGHPVGDEVLMQVAELVKSVSRMVDIVARFGGDEFFILLPESTSEYALALSRRLQTALQEQSFHVDEQDIKITASFGIVSCEPVVIEDSPSLDELIRAADQQLYQAKDGGRNRISWQKFT